MVGRILVADSTTFFNKANCSFMLFVNTPRRCTKTACVMPGAPPPATAGADAGGARAAASCLGDGTAASAAAAAAAACGS